MRVPTRQKLLLSLISIGLLDFALFDPLLTARPVSSTHAGSPVSNAEAEEVVSATNLDVLHDVILQLLPEDRHYREQLAGALASVYDGRGFRSLWPEGALLDLIFGPGPLLGSAGGPEGPRGPLGPPLAPKVHFLVEKNAPVRQCCTAINRA